ncbi:hypothetical protein FQZ97_1129060 [compost metagenome]
MVHGKPALLFFAVFQEGEIQYPQDVEVVRVSQAQPAAHFQAKLIQLLPGLVFLA